MRDLGPVSRVLHQGTVTADRMSRARVAMARSCSPCGPPTVSIRGQRLTRFCLGFHLPYSLRMWPVLMRLAGVRRDESSIVWYFNGRPVRSTENVYHQQYVCCPAFALGVAVLFHWHPVEGCFRGTQPVCGLVRAATWVPRHRSSFRLRHPPNLSALSRAVQPPRAVVPLNCPPPLSSCTHRALAFKFDSETMPNWFGLPEPTWRSATFKINYIRAWSREEVDTAGRAHRSVPRTVPATGEAAISPYALQRAPMPNSPEVAGLAEPVPRGGWSSLPKNGVRAVGRTLSYFGPVVV